MKNFDKLDKRIDIIREIVENNELIFEKNIKDILQMLDEEEMFINSSMLGLGDKVDIIFYEKKGEFDEESIVDRLIKSIDFNEYDKFKIVIFVHTIEEKIKVQENIEEKIGAYFKKNKKSKKMWEIDAQFVGSEEQISIGIGVDSTLSILEYEHLNPDAEGQVYNADLFDVVQLYNVVGDYLFKDNVREKIEDVLEVDAEIKRTLDEEPEKFWFYNNGITLMIDKDKLLQRREYQIDIKLVRDADISIINGAQTVSVAALYYYNLLNLLENDPNNPNLKSKLEKAKKAKVLLRIIKKDRLQKQTEFYRSISVSLNRQKAINDADIRYTNYLVDDINSLSEGKEAPFFSIDKRTDKNRKKISRHYDLERFVKISAMYLLQEPGSARAAKGKYIKQDVHWKRLNISDKGEISEELFLQKYRPYIIMDKMFEIISKKMNEVEKSISDVKLKNILKYGSEFLCAYIAWVANRKNNNDFTYFPEECNFDENRLLAIVNEFAKATYQCFVNEEIESNLFKKDKKYLELRDYLDGYDLIESIILKLFM